MEFEVFFPLTSLFLQAKSMQRIFRVFEYRVFFDLLYGKSLNDWSLWEH